MSMFNVNIYVSKIRHYSRVLFRFLPNPRRLKENNEK